MMRDMTLCAWHQLIVDGDFELFGDASTEPTFAMRCIWSCVIGESGVYPEAYGTHWDMHHNVIIDGIIQAAEGF